MQNSEWESVMETLTGLWPDFADTMTPEQMNMWRTKLNPYPMTWVQSALRDYYGFSRFKPKVVEIVELCARRAGDQSRTESDERPKPPGLHEVHRRVWGRPDISDDEVERIACHLIHKKYGDNPAVAQRAVELQMRDFNRARVTG